MATHFREGVIVQCPYCPTPLHRIRPLSPPDPPADGPQVLQRLPEWQPRGVRRALLGRGGNSQTATCLGLPGRTAALRLDLAPPLGRFEGSPDWQSQAGRVWELESEEDECGDERGE